MGPGLLLNRLGPVFVRSTGSAFDHHRSDGDFTGGNGPFKRLKTALKADIDADRACRCRHRCCTRPRPPPERSRHGQVMATESVAAERTAANGRPAPLRLLWITAAWGACFLAVQWGLRDAPLLWFATLRALTAGAALTLVAGVQRRPLPRSGSTWGAIAMLGVVNVSLAFATMFAGIAGGTTGVAAVLSNAQPLLILLPAWWLFGQRLSLRTAAAMAVGFSGLLVVAVPGGGGRGAMLSLLSAAAVTAGTLLVRRVHGADVVVFSAAHFLIGGVLLAVTAAAVEGTPHIHWTARFVTILAFLGLVGTAAAFLAWFVETQRCDLAKLTAWTFLVPVFGLMLGFVVLGERPGGWTAVGIALVLLAMWSALTQPNAAPAVPAHSAIAGPPPGQSGPHDT